MTESLLNAVALELPRRWSDVHHTYAGADKDLDTHKVVPFRKQTHVSLVCAFRPTAQVEVVVFVGRSVHIQFATILACLMCVSLQCLVLPWSYVGNVFLALT